VVSPAVLDAVRALRGTLSAEMAERLKEVRLFGSFAHGPAGEDSDVDVLVVIFALSPADRVRVFEAAEEISRAAGLDLMPLVVDVAALARLRAIGAPIYRQAYERGVPL
jgi:predicted nucleotidyltransferase